MKPQNRKQLLTFLPFSSSSVVITTCSYRIFVYSSLHAHYICESNWKTFVTNQEHKPTKEKVHNTINGKKLISTNTLWIRCVPTSDTCRVWYQHDTDTYNYTELYDFFNLLTVSVCQCPCRVRCSCPYLYTCFIGLWQVWLYDDENWFCKCWFSLKSN